MSKGLVSQTTEPRKVVNFCIAAVLELLSEICLLGPASSTEVTLDGTMFR